MEENVLNIVENLIEQLYQAKGFNNIACNPLERNIFEAEMKEKYLIVQGEIEDVVSTQEYLNDLSLWEERNAKLREELEQAEEALGDALNKNENLEETIEELEGRYDILQARYDDLIDKNCDLCEEKERYWKRLQEISKVVNDTWC